MLRYLCLVLFCGVALSSLAEWRSYKATFQKTYTDVEEQHRFWCFAHNLELIAQRNAVDPGVHGINYYADMCEDEFKVMHNLEWKNSTTQQGELWQIDEEEALSAAAASVDWRKQGVVTRVKNQGQCGSCWTFSTTGVLEAVHALATGKLIGLSEQELTSCAHSAGRGCQGGDMREAVRWVVLNGGIDSEADYPYRSGGGASGVCNTVKKARHVASFSRTVAIARSESQMASYMSTKGPLSIGVDASSWQTYRGGIMRNCGHQLDHGVLAVGYGTSALGEPYWIVKNSWGTSWGEAGYIRLYRGANTCGITTEVTSAVSK